MMIKSTRSVTLLRIWLRSEFHKDFKAGLKRVAALVIFIYRVTYHNLGGQKSMFGSFLQPPNHMSVT